VIPAKTTLVTELLTGAVDVWLGAKPSEADRLARTPGVRLMAYSYSKWDYLAWNTRLPFFDTPEERRALTLAIDRQALVDAVLHGHGTIGRSTVTPAHWSFNANDPAILLPYDTAEARRLLAGAGWRDRNGDGVLEDEQGRPFRFTLKTIQGDDAWKEVVEIVQAQLRRIGVDAQPQLLEFNALIALGEGSPNRDGVRNRDFEAVALHFYDDFRKDDSQILHSRNADRSVYQWTGFSHPRADWLLDTLKVMEDREAARPFWSEYQRLIVHESPFTLLFYPERLIAVRTRLQGVGADARSDLLTVARWWVPPDERRAAERRNP
jgi:peptide/nickel transport system substrate-binding protein